MKFGYYPIRGKAQPIRLLFHYLDVKYQQITHKGVDQWLQKDKFTIGLDFPNIPYLIDGQYKLTQSTAIPRYIARKSNHLQILGKTIQDQGKVDQLIGITQDLHMLLMNSIYFGTKENYQKRGEVFEKLMKPKLGYIQTFLGNKDFLIGYITYADFFLQEFLNKIKILFPDSFSQRFQKYIDNFQSLPKIKEFYSKEQNKKMRYMPQNKGYWDA